MHAAEYPYTHQVLIDTNTSLYNTCLVSSIVLHDLVTRLIHSLACVVVPTIGGVLETGDVTIPVLL